MLQKSFPTRCSPHALIDIRHDVAKIAGLDKSEGGSFLLHHVAQIRGKGSGSVSGSKGAGVLDELDQLRPIRLSPLVSVHGDQREWSGR